MRLFFLAFLFVAGCTRSDICVVQDFIDKNNLASSFAYTPDPLLRCPPTGQRLLIDWRAPSKQSTDHCLVLSVIYRNLEEERFCYPVCGNSGQIEHLLLGEKYLDTKGLFTYKIELLDDKKELVACFEHRMWVKIIRPEGEKEGPWRPLPQDSPGCGGQYRGPLENGLDQDLDEFAYQASKNSLPSNP